MDGIIDQLNKTKKLFIIMLLTIMIIPPIAFMLSFMLFGFPFHDDSQNGGNGWWWNDGGREDGRHVGMHASRNDEIGSIGAGDSSSSNINNSEQTFGEIPSNTKPWEEGSNSNPSFRYLPLIPVIVVLVWLGIGIRQWFVLSKWDKKYKKYKEMQKKIDEKLDKDDDNKTQS